MILVGLTGGIASGKSTVSAILKNNFHCPVVDADLIAREVVEPGKRAYVKIVKYFGEQILLDDRTLDRPKLGEIVFKDVEKRRKLNSITHPEIGKAILWEIFKYFISGHRFIILDIPLLFESKTWMKITTLNVVVYCEGHTQLSRLTMRNDLSKEEAQRRIDAQMSLEEKKKLATVVIDNNGTRKETYKQVEQLHQTLKSSKRYLLMRGVLLGAVASLTALIFCLFS